MPRKDFLCHAEFDLGLKLESKLDFVDLTSFDFRFVNCAVAAAVVVVYDFDFVVGIEYLNEAVAVAVAAVENENDIVFVLEPDSEAAVDDFVVECCRLLDHVVEYNTDAAEVEVEAVRWSKLMIID